MILLVATLALADWEPRDWPSPALGVSAAAPAPAPRQDLLSRAYGWYRKRSDKDGARCPFYPTCSAYGLQAVRTWGVPVGLWLLTDRFTREYPWMAKADDYPVVTPHRTPRFHDPVPDRHRHRD